VSFDPLLDLQGRKTLKLGPSFGLFTSFFCVSRDFCPFWDIFGNFLLNNASDERVGGVPLFWAKGG
jgi:hypothetical protein